MIRFCLQFHAVQNFLHEAIYAVKNKNPRLNELKQEEVALARFQLRLKQEFSTTASQKKISNAD